MFAPQHLKLQALRSTARTGSSLEAEAGGAEPPVAQSQGQRVMREDLYSPGEAQQPSEQQEPADADRLSAPDSQALPQPLEQPETHPSIDELVQYEAPVMAKGEEAELANQFRVPRDPAASQDPSRSNASIGGGSQSRGVPLDIEDREVMFVNNRNDGGGQRALGPELRDLPAEYLGAGLMPAQELGAEVQDERLPEHGIGPEPGVGQGVGFGQPAAFEQLAPLDAAARDEQALSAAIQQPSAPDEQRQAFDAEQDGLD